MKFPVTIPNIISLARLLAFPVILALALAGHERIFSILLVISLFSDLVDGWIARTFNQVTEVGARLDSIADIGSYILALTGIFVFKWEDFKPVQVYLFIFIGLFLLRDLVPLVKFRRASSLHLYSSRIGGYIQGGFFVVLFTWGFFEWYYYLTVISGYIAFSECTIINLASREHLLNAKGLYWVIKEKRL